MAEILCFFRNFSGGNLLFLKFPYREMVQKKFLIFPLIGVNLENLFEKKFPLVGIDRIFFSQKQLKARK